MPTQYAPPETLTLRELREKIGPYVPAPRRPVDWAAFDQATRRIQEDMASKGLTEEDILEDLKAIKDGRLR